MRKALMRPCQSRTRKRRGGEEEVLTSTMAKLKVKRDDSKKVAGKKGKGDVNGDGGTKMKKKKMKGGQMDAVVEDVEPMELNEEFVDLDTFFAQQKEDEREMEQEKVEKKREKKTKLVEKRKKKVEKVPQEQQWLVSDEDFTGGRWFECAPEWPVDPKGTVLRQSDLHRGKELLSEAREMYNKKFRAQAVRNSSMKSGTISDQIASLTLAVQESPVHHVEELEKLVEMVTVKATRVKQIVQTALQDLFLHDLLPDRLLIPIHARRSFDAPPMTDRHLLYAHFESVLKSCLSHFLEHLRLSSIESIPKLRSDSVTVAYNLLSEKPEGEQMLLTLIVNKLGDPDRQVASKAVFQLTNLLKKHPAMKLILLREIEALIFRANVKRRAQYYAITFMIQIQLRQRDIDAARKMVDMYLTLFNKLTMDTKEIDLDIQETKIVAALLVGVNRAFPYTKAAVDELYDTSRFEVLFRVAHAHSFRSSTQALALLQQVAEAREGIEDRFYRTLYAKLMSEEVRSCKNPSSFLNVVYKAMKGDNKLARVQAFAKRLLQSGMHGSPGFVCGILTIISRTILRGRRGVLHSFIATPEMDNQVENFHDRVETIEMEAEKAENGKEEATTMGRDYKEDSELTKNIYDPRKRDPLYCHADSSSLWELGVFVNHYHPSVQKFATDLLEREREVRPAGNPLIEFSLMSFLDRFVYKKPKKHVKSSLYANRSESGRKIRPAVDTEEFRELIRSNGKVAEDDRFFKRYFENRKLPEVVKGEQEEADKTGNEFDSDEEDAEIDAALQEALKDEGAMLGVDADGADDIDEAAFKAALAEADDDDEDGTGDDEDGADDDEDGMNDDDINGDGLDLKFASEEADDDDNEEKAEEEDRGLVLKQKRKRPKELSAFAPAEDFAEEVEAIWKMQQAQQTGEDGGGRPPPRKRQKGKSDTRKRTKKR